jgi:retron-type reverse transcriptase
MVLDRFIQQAMMQVLQADWDRTFSETSFGFRPRRSAHQTVAKAQAYIASGHDVVVVNHDILMCIWIRPAHNLRAGGLTMIKGALIHSCPT